MEHAIEIPSLEEFLTGELSRDKFRELKKTIHSSFTHYRFADRRTRELLEALEQTTKGDEKKSLTLKAGVILTALGSYDRALPMLTEVRDNKDAQFFMALIQMRQDRYKDAIALLSKGFSSDTEAQAMLAECYLILRQCDEAQRVIKHAGLDNEDSSQACYLGGRVAECEGEYERAIELYKKAIELEAGNVSAMFRLAFNYDLNGQDDKSIELYEKCAAVAPTDASVLVNLGVLYEDQDLYYEAIECYRRIVEIEPNNLRVKMYLKDAESSLTMWVDEEELKKMKQEDEVLKIPVSDFELSVRSRNCLERMGITTLGDLTRVSEPDLLSFKNFGETSLNEIRQMLTQKGLHLGQSLEPMEGEEQEPEEQTLQKEMESKLSTSILQLNLSTRARRCMERLEVDSVGDLIKYSEEQLLAMPNFGRTSVNELKEKLADLGLEMQKKK